VVVAVLLLVEEAVIDAARRRKSHAVFDLIVLDRMAMLLLLFVSVRKRGCGSALQRLRVWIVSNRILFSSRLVN
jgi:hypothetical protein